MSDHITPEQFECLLNGELTEAEQQTIEAHVENCGACEKELEQLLETAGGDSAKADWWPDLHPEPAPTSVPEFLHRLREQTPSPPPTKPDSEDDGDDSAIQFPDPPTTQGPRSTERPYSSRPIDFFKGWDV